MNHYEANLSKVSLLNYADIDMFSYKKEGAIYTLNANLHSECMELEVFSKKATQVGIVFQERNSIQNLTVSTTEVINVLKHKNNWNSLIKLKKEGIYTTPLLYNTKTILVFIFKEHQYAHAKETFQINLKWYS